MDFRIIIKEQRKELEEIETRERLIDRESQNKALKYLKHPNILAVIGIRRCGKSIFSYLLAKEHSFGYVNFDDERLIGISAEDLNNVLDAFYELYNDVEFIVLDEIQNIKNWELFANRLRRTKKVMITGSNSKLLEGELATHLTGRYMDTKLYPFSFREFLKLKQVRLSSAYTTREKAGLIGNLEQYMATGGFPEVYKFDRSILPRIYDDIVTKDVILRYGIRKKDELKKFARYLVTNFSNEITYSKLSRILDIKHVSTVSNWISYLEQAFLIIKLERFDFKLKQQFVAPKKVYCIDTGIINSISFSTSENKGKIMENIVAVQLQRKYATEHGPEVYYWKDHQQKEVDFVIKKGAKIIELIQVTNASRSEEVNERELRSLVKASGELKSKNLKVITWDLAGEETIDKMKVKFTPLWSWLLE